MVHDSSAAYRTFRGCIDTKDERSNGCILNSSKMYLESRFSRLQFSVNPIYLFGSISSTIVSRSMLGVMMRGSKRLDRRSSHDAAAGLTIPFKDKGNNLTVSIPRLSGCRRLHQVSLDDIAEEERRLPQGLTGMYPLLRYGSTQSKAWGREEQSEGESVLGRDCTVEVSRLAAVTADARCIHYALRKKASWINRSKRPMGENESLRRNSYQA